MRAQDEALKSADEFGRCVQEDGARQQVKVEPEEHSRRTESVMTVNPSGGDGSLLELSGKLNSFSFSFSLKKKNFKL